MHLVQHQVYSQHQGPEQRSIPQPEPRLLEVHNLREHDIRCTGDDRSTVLLNLAWCPALGCIALASPDRLEPDTVGLALDTAGEGAAQEQRIRTGSAHSRLHRAPSPCAPEQFAHQLGTMEYTYTVR